MKATKYFSARLCMKCLVDTVGLLKVMCSWLNKLLLHSMHVVYESRPYTVRIQSKIYRKSTHISCNERFRDYDSIQLDFIT